MKAFFKSLKVVLPISLYFILYGAFSQDVILNGAEYVLAESDIWMLSDSAGELNEKDVLEGVYDKGFTKASKSELLAEPLNYWLKFRLVNLDPGNENFYLGTDRFSHLQGYFKQDSIWEGPIENGMSLPFENRSVANEGYSFFEINLPHGDTLNVYLHAQNLGLKKSLLRYKLPLSVMTFEEYKRAYERPDSFTYLYLGASFLLFFFVIILWLLTRQKIYFFYLGYILFNLLFLVGISPHFGYSLFGNTDLQGTPNLIFGQLATIFFILFTQDLLFVKKHYPRINKILNGILLSCVLVIFLTSFGLFLDARIIISSIGFLLLYPTVLVYCVLMARKKHLPSIMMFISIVLYVVGAYVSGLQYAEVIPAFIYGMSPLTISQVACLIGDSIFALIIGMKINEERNLRLEQEREKQVILEKQNEELESQVSERTAELQESLTNLKSTQKQLIQTEKLASLGELMAGIAHEIQNPLNFVNNFAEVSEELVREIKEEKDKPDKERDANLEGELLSDIEQNLEKISHHGKRASNIVKGMLEHSRNATEGKEEVDVNEMAEEYLKLAFHGLRAKNKSFNSDFRTNFDENLPKVKVNVQDFGRVLLNLINNAFYSVSEQQKEANTNYKPLVSVSTKNTKKGVFISIKDNGIGIPEEIKDKILQPFFTTKPTCQGTGLGLSLAYDIITNKHQGELSFKSEISKGSEFTIFLPI